MLASALVNARAYRKTLALILVGANPEQAGSAMADEIRLGGGKYCLWNNQNRCLYSAGAL